MRNVLVILEGRVIGNHVDLTETVREGVDHEKHQSRAVTDPLRDHLEKRDQHELRRKAQRGTHGRGYVICFWRFWPSSSRYIKVFLV